MIDSSELVEIWEDVVEHILAYEEPEEIEEGLIRRDAVAHDTVLTPELLRRVERADREFIRIRPLLVERFPGEFDPEYWGAKDDEWWWWPDRLPASLAHSS